MARTNVHSIEQITDLQDTSAKLEDYIRKPIFLNTPDVDCVICHFELSTPYVVCNICNINICSSCFATGLEISGHLNNHEYTIFNDNFPLFEDTNWSAKEELILLNSLLEYGNFSIVVEKLPSRTLNEIKEHYEYYYLEGFGSDLFPTFPKRFGSKQCNGIIPYSYQLTDNEDPPRYAAHTVGFHSLAGYNAIRSEFEQEYDIHAEDLVSNLKFNPVKQSSEHYTTLIKLQCAMLSSYNVRLTERQRRKFVIKSHGLIVTRKMVAWLQRYDITITRRVYERICQFIQYYTGQQFEYFMEGLHRSGELKTEISRLCTFHKKGIRTIKGGDLYFELKHLHDASMNTVKLFQNNNQLNWKIKDIIESQILPVNKKRGIFSPLDVVGLPGHEKLTQQEQDLCRNVRLVPLSYIEFRDILMNENRKIGYLKLQTARRLLKIDVNKTRRLYDFLAHQGYIQKL